MKFLKTVIFAACAGIAFLANAAAVVPTQEELNKQLFQAAKKGLQLEVERLIRNGAQVNTRQTEIAYEERCINTPLHAAVSHDHMQVIKYLVACGADIDITNNEEKTTPLMLAAWDGSYEIVEYLVTCGANVHATDRLRNTPLMHVSYGANPDRSEEERSKVIQFFLANHAQVDIIDDAGNTALHWYCLNHNAPSVIEAFVAAGADKDHVNKQGFTILTDTFRQHTLTKDKKGLIHALLKFGTDMNRPSIRDDINKTYLIYPLFFAAYNNMPDTACLMIAHDAQIENIDEKGSSSNILDTFLVSNKKRPKNKEYSEIISVLQATQRKPLDLAFILDRPLPTRSKLKLKD